MAFDKWKAQLAEPIKQANGIAVLALGIALLALFVAMGARNGA
jgi:hypothetical protein